MYFLESKSQSQKHLKVDQERMKLKLTYLNESCPFYYERFSTFAYHFITIWGARNKVLKNNCVYTIEQ